MLQKVISDPEARELLGGVAESLELRDEVKATMKTFVLSKIYNEDTSVRLLVGRQGLLVGQNEEEEHSPPPS